MQAFGRSSLNSPSDLVNVNRYPILERTGPGYQDFVLTCRAQLKETGACELPGFLRADALAAMVEEAEKLAPLAYHSTITGNAYLEPIDPATPEDHPKRMTETTALGAVAYDQFPENSLIRALYEWDELKTFLADAIGVPELHRYADPMGALNLAVMKEGDYLRWHFDQTDFVTSVALQSSDEGGAFEYVPLIRTPKDERFSQVRALLKGSRKGVKTIPITPGTLLLFHGRYSIHRVTEIKGKRLRHVGLFGYDVKPGVTSSEHLQYIRYGRKAGETSNT